jgi:hypothetical protein
MTTNDQLEVRTLPLRLCISSWSTQWLILAMVSKVTLVDPTSSKINWESVQICSLKIKGLALVGVCSTKSLRPRRILPTRAKWVSGLRLLIRLTTGPPSISHKQLLPLPIIGQDKPNHSERTVCRGYSRKLKLSRLVDLNQVLRKE